MVEYITTLINKSKQDGMLVTLEVRSRLTSFNWALKVFLPFFSLRVFLYLFLSFASSTRNFQLPGAIVPVPFLHGCW
jgi:hypothetical protein